MTDGPRGPRDTPHRPFVEPSPLTDAESGRNERFDDMRRTRFLGGERLDGAPGPARGPAR